MQTNQAGVDLIKEFEGWEPHAYRDPVGIWTIGYGHTSRAGPPRVEPGMVLTPAEGEALLRTDLRSFERYVEQYILEAMNENEFASFVSFCYNVGPSAFKGSSVCKRFNKGDKRGAEKAFHLWNKAGGRVLRGLVRRRAREAELFARPDRLDITPIAYNNDVSRSTGKPLVKSKTAWSSLGLSGISFYELSPYLTTARDFFTSSQGLLWVVVAGLGAFIIYDRWKKGQEDDV